MTAETDRLSRRAAGFRHFRSGAVVLTGLLLGGLNAAGAAQGNGQPHAGLSAPTAPSGLAPLTQQLAQKSAQKPAPNGVNTPKPLSAAERQTLQELLTKVRPATLRIEQCDLNVPGACDDPAGIGSGVLISADGLALTAYHVVEGARKLSAQTVDKKRYAVQLVGYDDQYDLALLRVAVPSGTPFVPVASTRPSVGDALLAVGNGGGNFLTAKSGRLTGLEAEAGPGGATFPPGTLQMSVPLIPGDSGGPVLNLGGELAGIVSYISVSRAKGPASFAVPVTASDARLAQLRAGQKNDAPMIGIGLNGAFNSLVTIDATDFKLLKLGNTPGAFFTSVVQGSPAAKAGLQPLKFNDQAQVISGDIVTEVDGKRIINFDEFQYAVRAYKPGDTITLTVLRNSKPLTVKLTLIGRSQR